MLVTGVLLIVGSLIAYCYRSTLADLPHLFGGAKYRRLGEHEGDSVNPEASQMNEGVEIVRSLNV